MLAKIIREKEYTGEMAGYRGKPALIKRKNGSILEIAAQYEMACGMGEKFDFLNQKGQDVVNQVVEKFCNQGSSSYCVTPFFMTEAGIFRIYAKVIMPLTKSAIATLTVTTFMESWNDYLWPLLMLSDKNKMTLTLALNSLNILKPVSCPAE